MNRYTLTLFTFCTILFMASTCKEPTPPQEAECNAGYLPCDGHRSQCCELTCDDGFHNCGETLTDCCMDSTSHNFTWTIDTLGIYGSYLNDVAIVDENNIWVVGNIETDSGSYNAARWDGNEWEMMRIINSADLYSIFYFSEDDIWVTTFGLPIHWDGEEWTLYHIQNMGIDASAGFDCWGTSSSNMYFVGYQGSIVHYDGVNFVKMESGTDVDLKDIAGTPDGEYVFVAGRNNDGRSVALSITNNTVTKLYEGLNQNSQPYGGVRSVSVYGDTVYFGSTICLWKYNYRDLSSTVIYEEGNYMSIYPVQTIVQGPNDIFLCGARSEIIHYNGSTWNADTFVWDYVNHTSLSTYNMDVNGNILVTVGYVYWGTSAYIARGYRY